MVTYCATHMSGVLMCCAAAAVAATMVRLEVPALGAASLLALPLLAPLLFAVGNCRSLLLPSDPVLSTDPLLLDSLLLARLLEAADE